MKEGIHPTYYPDALFTCGSCGTTWRAGSTKKDVHLDICSNCHPFYTGTQRIVDTAGQVERFTKRLTAHETAVEGGQVKGSKRQRRIDERAKRSGMLEAMQPEPAPEPVVAASGTETVARAEAPAEGTPAPRERKPRPPRERKPRAENKPAESASTETASNSDSEPAQ